MQKRQDNYISISPSFYIFLSGILLFIPLKISLGWLLAVGVHELSHYIALRFCGVKARGISLQGLRILMDTEPMNWKQELICSVAGPLGGLSLLLTARQLPVAAVFAFVHSVYNLLPIYPLDGGRALLSVLRYYIGEDRGERTAQWIGRIAVVLLLGICIYLTITLKYILILACGILLLFTVFRGKNSLQR